MMMEKVEPTNSFFPRFIFSHFCDRKKRINGGKNVISGNGGKIFATFPIRRRYLGNGAVHNILLHTFASLVSYFSHKSKSEIVEQVFIDKAEEREKKASRYNPTSITLYHIRLKNVRVEIACSNINHSRRSKKNGFLFIYFSMGKGLSKVIFILLPTLSMFVHLASVFMWGNSIIYCSMCAFSPSSSSFGLIANKTSAFVLLTTILADIGKSLRPK